MEKTGTVHVDLGDTTKLTWIEYKLEQFVELIKERLSAIVQPKDVVSDFDKSIWFTSIVVLLGKVLPANRFLFRIVEEENQFLIQLHDPAQLQQPQTIEVPYRKVFDWKIGSWEEAKSVPTKEERLKLFLYWQENGYSHTDIAEHFGVNRCTINQWPKSVCRRLANKKQRYEEINHPANVVTLLRKAGMKSICDQFLSQICKCHLRAAASAQRRVRASEGPFHKIDYERAIEYVNLIIYKLSLYSKSLGSGKLDHHDRLIGKTVRVSTGIRVTNKRSYNPIKRWNTPSINQEKQKDAIVFLNNVLNNLNQMKGE